MLTKSCKRVSILAPLAYIAFLVGSLALFSRVYRRKAKVVPDPWFPVNKDRDIYYSLLSLEPPPPRPILVAALIRRAMEALRRVWQIREQKPALNTLLLKGQIGDATWEKFLEAEKELEAEIVELIEEANTFQEGYGKNLLAFASDMVTHEKWKDIYTAIPAKQEAEKARRANPTSTPLFGPTSHLTPTSLTLYPSNPLPLAPSPATETPASKVQPATPAPQSKQSLPPPATLPVAPPSPVLQPTASTSKAVPAPESSSSATTKPEASTSTSTASGAGGATTPPASAKKPKGKKKKPVKGGR